MALGGPFEAENVATVLEGFFGYWPQAVAHDKYKKVRIEKEAFVVSARPMVKFGKVASFEDAPFMLPL